MLTRTPRARQAYAARDREMLAAAAAAKRAPVAFPTPARSRFPPAVNDLQPLANVDYKNLSDVDVSRYKIKVLSRHPGPRVFVVEDFLNETEVDYVLRKAHGALHTFQDTADTGISLEMTVDNDPVLVNIAKRQYKLLGVQNLKHFSFRTRRYVDNKFHNLHIDS